MKITRPRDILLTAYRYDKVRIKGEYPSVTPIDFNKESIMKYVKEGYLKKSPFDTDSYWITEKGINLLRDNGKIR